jgi:hypothetical protein
MSTENQSVVVGIIVGSLITSVFILALLYYVLRLWIRGPMKGTDNQRRLDGRVVVITGNFHSIIQSSKFIMIKQLSLPISIFYVNLISGANSGIGRATARDLYRRGAEVVMLCRNLTKAEKTADKVKLKPQF